MQSGYGGGVSEMQQFLVDGCASTLFSIPPTPPQPGNPTGTADIHTAAAQQALKYHPQPPRHHPPPVAATPHFPHFHPMPITQQLFQQTHHQFQLFHHHHYHHPQQEQNRMIPNHHHQQLGLDQESGPENSSSPTRLMGGGGGGGVQPPPSFLAAAMSFKLAVNESSGGGSQEGMNDEEGILQGEDGSESRFHPWQREEESAIKEPFWRPLDIDYINRNNKRCKEKEAETSTNSYCKKSKEAAGQGNSTSGSNYKLFSELEAIYKPGGGCRNSGGGTNNNQTAGSGSALTGDENPNPIVTAAEPGLACDQRAAAADHGSDTSTGGAEVPRTKLPKGGGGGGGRRKRKRRQQQQLSSIAAFFESLVKQLMEHQETLHRKFLEVMERRDQERTSRDEAWRRQEAAKSSREAAERAQERALAATREAAIIFFLEKITGESLDLPTKSQFLFEEANKEDNKLSSDNNNLMKPSDAYNNNNADSIGNMIQLNTSRWPRTEVQALIRVRGGLESKFQEPGLKGPLWEEVSTTMASIGYHRNAKRCKEKWENINKYFRKTKDSGKKRPQHSKTCPYFHQLDQLYSKNNAGVALGLHIAESRDNSQLLDAIVVSTDHQFNFSEMGPLMIDFKGNEGDNAEAGGAEMAAKVRKEDELDDDGDEEDGGDEEEGEGEEGEGEGESQGQWQEKQHLIHDHLNCKVPFLSDLPN